MLTLYTYVQVQTFDISGTDEESSEPIPHPGSVYLPCTYEVCSESIEVPLYGTGSGQSVCVFCERYANDAYKEEARVCMRVCIVSHALLMYCTNGTCF